MVERSGLLQRGHDVLARCLRVNSDAYEVRERLGYAGYTKILVALQVDILQRVQKCPEAIHLYEIFEVRLHSTGAVALCTVCSC